MLIGRRPNERESTPKHFIGPERRDATRFHTVLRVARVVRKHDVGLWRVRNISDKGLMLTTHIQLIPGERLQVNFSNTVSLVGTAIWWDGERCGVAFEQPICCAEMLAALLAEQKAPGYRPLRLNVATRAIAFCDKGLHTVRVYNMSQHGAGITHDGCCHEGMTVKLHFETGEEYRGVVRWSKEGKAGLFLTDPIACARLESANRI